jgi:hypothetical protein
MKPSFLNTPEAWTRAQRTALDPARDAYAIERGTGPGRPEPLAERVLGVMLAVGIGVAVALLAVHTLAGA